MPPPPIIDYKFTNTGLVWLITIKADDVIGVPLHTDKVFTFTHTLSISLVWWYRVLAPPLLYTGQYQEERRLLRSAMANTRQG